MPANDTLTPPPLLLNVADASKALAISPRKLWSLMAGGEIPAIRIGRSVRYLVSDLCEFIDQQKQGGAHHET